MKRKEYAEKLLPLVENVLPMACRMLKCQAQAEDVVQEVLITIWEKRKNIHIHSNYKSFLYRAVKNKCLDKLKQAKMTPLSVAENVKSLDENGEFDTMAWIADCIKTLPEMQQQVLNMREIDGLEFNEISELLDLKEAHVRVLLSRAKKALQEIIPKGLE